MDQKPFFIIVIDTSETICQLLKMWLTREGYEVRSFQNPREALSAIVTKSVLMPDLFLIDRVLLPRFDGYEVMRQIRRMHEGTHVPIIITLSVDSPLDRFKARVQEVTYVTKPFKIEDVIALVQTYASKRFHSQ